METLEIIIWSMIEMIKYILVLKGVLGCKIRNDWKKYLIFLYIIAGGAVWGYLVDELFLYRITFGFIISLLVFEEKISVKIKGYLFSCFIIDVTDLFLWSAIIMFFPVLERMDESGYLGNLAGCIWWLGIVLLVRRKNQKIYDYFIRLSFSWTVVIVLVIFGLGLVAGGIQLSLSGTLSQQAQKKILLIYMAMIMWVVLGSVILIYNIITRKNLEKIHEIEQENLLLQQKYYEGKIQQNEEIQKFRHDMQKHMKVIELLCERNEIEELKEYVKGYLQEYPKQENIHTGNIISDYFIGETVLALREKKDFEYNIIGTFPEKLVLTNVELCILMANALENAKNAILQVEGSAFLLVELRNYNGHIIINIENSKRTEMGKTTKNVKPGHGYGLKNMRAVVEKHNGKMEIIDEGELFKLSIFI